MESGSKKYGTDHPKSSKHFSLKFFADLLNKFKEVRENDYLSLSTVWFEKLNEKLPYYLW